MTRFSKFRIASAVATFIVLTAESGLFLGIICALVIALTTQLRTFRNVFPKVLYESDGKPTYVAERLAVPVFMLATAAILMCVGALFSAFLIAVVAVFDLLQDSEWMDRLFDYISDKLRRM